jgi:hypothetical protein
MILTIIIEGGGGGEARSEILSRHCNGYTFTALTTFRPTDHGFPRQIPGYTASVGEKEPY